MAPNLLPSNPVDCIVLGLLRIPNISKVSGSRRSLLLEIYPLGVAFSTQWLRSNPLLPLTNSQLSPVDMSPLLTASFNMG